MKIVLSILYIIFSFISVIASPIELSILFTGDTWGHPLKFSYKGSDNQGGIPARNTLIKKLTGDKKDENVLLLDTGNITLGNFESNYYEGIPDAVGMSVCKYDAAGIGLAEVWHGTKYFFDIFNKNTKFLLLSSNVKYMTLAKVKEYLADNYLVKTYGGVGGIKVGIFSVLSPSIYSYLPAKVQKEIVIDDPVETAKAVVDDLKNREKVDIIIAMTNLGIEKGNYDYGALSFATNVSGIDIILDGSGEEKIEEPIEVNNVKVCQAYKFGLFLGEIKLACDGRKITGFEYKSYPVNYSENNILTGEEIKEDEKTLSAIKAKMKDYDKAVYKKIVNIKNGILGTDNIRNRETEFGNLICDSMLEYTGADVALQNAGGIVNDAFDLKNISRKTFNNAIKYDNTIAVLFMTGKQLRDTLQYSVYRKNYGGFLQVAGVKFTYSKSDNQIKEIKISNEPLEDQGVYKVVTNSYLADGGDGHRIFKDIKVRLNLNVLFRETVYDYLENKKNYQPALNDRINAVD
jgi:2',3'-cyclic-nucleotide 2'-phosphodiesterase (5'-nucleotidase family)